MTGNGTGPAPEGRARLKAVLDAYGADPARWPEGERAALEELLAGDPEAAHELEDAREIDRLLDRASAPVARKGAAARVLAAAMEQEAGSVVAFEPRERTGSTAAMRRLAWPAAGLMAASLLVGVYLGQSDFLNGAGTGTFLTADTTLDVIDDALFGLSGGVIPFTEETL